MKTFLSIAALILCIALVHADKVQDQVNGILQQYGNPKNKGTPRSGSIIVNNVHHLKPEYRDELFREKNRYAKNNNGEELLVATDQEGGKVSRLRSLFPSFKFHSAKAMGKMTAEEVFEHGAEVGKLLLQSGVNMNLAPVLDVSDDNTLMPKQGRAFGNTAEIVTVTGQAFVSGIRSTFPQCALIAKHFPGYNFKRNSDVTPVLSRQSKEEIEARMKPFMDVQGLTGVMMNSVRYEAFGGEVAAMSKELIQYIRNKDENLIVMTDDIVAPSLVDKSLEGQARYDAIAQVAMKCFKAGCDLILAMDGRAIRTISKTMANEIRGNAALEAQLEKSYNRLKRLRDALKRTTPRIVPTPALGAINAAENCIREAKKVKEAQVALGVAADGKWGSMSQGALNRYERQMNRKISQCLTKEKLEILRRERSAAATRNFEN